MIEKDFIKHCEDKLIALSEAIEDLDKNLQLDVEYSDGILKIGLETTKQTYVINKHSASQKIWYSSPISGADYFSFDEVLGKWLDSKGKELSEKLFSELNSILSK